MKIHTTGATTQVSVSMRLEGADTITQNRTKFLLRPTQAMAVIIDGVVTTLVLAGPRVRDDGSATDHTIDSRYNRSQIHDREWAPHLVLEVAEAARQQVRSDITASYELLVHEHAKRYRHLADTGGLRLDGAQQLLRESGYCDAVVRTAALEGKQHGVLCGHALPCEHHPVPVGPETVRRWKDRAPDVDRKAPPAPETPADVADYVHGAVAAASAEPAGEVPQASLRVSVQLPVEIEPAGSMRLISANGVVPMDPRSLILDVEVGNGLQRLSREVTRRVNQRMLELGH